MRSGDLDPECGPGPLRAVPSLAAPGDPAAKTGTGMDASVRRIASAERPTRRLQHGRSKQSQGCGGLSGPRRHRHRQGHPPCRLAGGAFDPPGRAGVDRSLPDRALRGFGAARLRDLAGRPGRAGAAGRAGLPAAAAAGGPRAFEALASSARWRRKASHAAKSRRGRVSSSGGSPGPSAVPPGQAAGARSAGQGWRHYPIGTDACVNLKALPESFSFCKRTRRGFCATQELATGCLISRRSQRKSARCGSFLNKMTNAESALYRASGRWSSVCLGKEDETARLALVRQAKRPLQGLCMSRKTDRLRSFVFNCQGYF